MCANCTGSSWKTGTVPVLPSACSILVRSQKRCYMQGSLAQLDSQNPVLYIDFPQGRLKFLGTIVFPKSKYMLLKFGQKDVLCEDIFENMVGMCWTTVHCAPGTVILSSVCAYPPLPPALCRLSFLRHTGLAQQRRTQQKRSYHCLLSCKRQYMTNTHLGPLHTRQVNMLYIHAVYAGHVVYACCTACFTSCI